MEITSIHALTAQDLRSLEQAGQTSVLAHGPRDVLELEAFLNRSAELNEFFARQQAGEPVFLVNEQAQTLQETADTIMELAWIQHQREVQRAKLEYLRSVRRVR